MSKIRLVMISKDGSRHKQDYNFDCGDAWHSRYNLRLVAEQLMKEDSNYINFEYDYE